MQAKLIKDKEFDISIVESEIFSDDRGYIEKIFSNFFNVKEVTVTFAKKDSIRGMHYQKNNPQAKIIKILSGKILDVCLDIRNDSVTYNKVFSKMLKKGQSIMIPRGYAHGFQAIEDSYVLMIYDEITIAKFSAGYSYKSKGINNFWYKTKRIYVSDGDKCLEEFND